MRTETNTPSPSGYAGRTVTKPPNWHDLVVLDVLFNNLATGLFLVAAVADLTAPSLFATAAAWAYPIALVLLLIDLGLLVLDLGDMLRFHHMLRVFKPSSPMSLGTWCLTVYSFFLTAIVALELIVSLDILPSDTGLMTSLRTLAVAGGIPFAFGSAAYKGVLFSTTAQPGWKDARWLGAYLVNSAFLLGAGELLAIAAVLGEAPAEGPLAAAVGWLAAINVVPLGLLANDLHPTLARLYSRRYRWAAGAGIVLVGIAIPIVLAAVGGGIVRAFAIPIALVATHLYIRFVLVLVPHRVS